MNRYIYLPIVLLGFLLGCNADNENASTASEDGPAQEITEGPVAATVGEAAIPVALLNRYLEVRDRDATDPEQRRTGLEELINLQLLVNEATRKGITEGRDMQLDLELQRRTLIGNRLFSDFAADSRVTEEQIKAEYESGISRAGTTEYKLRHILVGDREKAVAIVDRLQQGENFEEVETSVDAMESGDLGWINPAQVPESFGPALEELEPGESTAEPVESEFGFHVLLLEDRRAQEPPPLEEVSEGIARSLGQRAWQAYVATLRERYSVEIVQP